MQDAGGETDKRKEQREERSGSKEKSRRKDGNDSVSLQIASSRVYAFFSSFFSSFLSSFLSPGAGVIPLLKISLIFSSG